MKITVNGEHKDVGGVSTLSALFEMLQIVPNALVVEHNGTIVDRERYANIVLKEGDVLELVRFVGGG